jgi:hypothetical protein
MALLLCAAGTKSLAADADLKLEAQLVIGTNDAKPPDSKYQPVNADVAKKLKSLPLKWSNYFVVSSKKFSVPKGEEKQEKLGDCDVKVKNLGQSQVVITISGKKGTIGTTTGELSKAQLFVTGANETNLFVVLKQVD